ncbi:cilia- and flagella-associated protein 161 isoform X2 [Corvus hawaiiensis]|uniref:cilia- and flagella-associated protein 161 isoform X2 n=1 Tax=Corvus hawaiiensis TaxID=134902 RepID=UPI002018A634|nr:cilia- and flagella-associated protein 161 isoform X2 [Corvus hawaiiensis]
MASYRLGVRVGNWLEEELAEEERLRDFIRKREQGQLLGQRLARLQESVFKKVELSLSSDGFVHFGDTVLLMNPDNKSSKEREPEISGDVTLAVDMEEVSLYSDEPLQISRGLSAVKSVDPMGRNAFCIVSVDGSAVGEPLRYGQNFLIGTKGGVSDKMTETKIIITHCYTNRNLAIPRTFCVWSYFGREFEVICHNYLDSHKAEDDQNHWEIVTGNPGPEDGTMLERPEALPEGYKNE